MSRRFSSTTIQEEIDRAFGEIDLNSPVVQTEEVPESLQVRDPKEVFAMCITG